MTGERSQRNLRVAEYLLSRDGDPLEWLMQTAATPVEDLATALGCDRRHAMREKILAASGAMLLFHQRPDLPSRVSDVSRVSAMMIYPRLASIEPDAAKWTTEHPEVNALVQEGMAIAIRFLDWMGLPAKLTQVTRASILAVAKDIAMDQRDQAVLEKNVRDALAGRSLPNPKEQAASPAAAPKPQITPSAGRIREAMVDKLRERAEGKQPKPPTEAQRKLLAHSLAIFGEPATKNDTAYMPRELVQITLPHRNPGNVPAWTRRNGNRSVTIQPGWNAEKKRSFGYPYGTIPRLLLFWITTEAKRKPECGRRIELGSSLSGFMAELGLNSANGSSGAKRSDARRLRDQMERLFNAPISFASSISDDGREITSRLNMYVAPRSELWWNLRDPDQGAMWGSWIELGEDFRAAITASPVPVDMRALKALKGSSLALDLYAWLSFEAFRAQKSGKARFETWAQLHAHFGAEYGRLDNFRSKAKAALRKIKTVYPKLRLGDRLGGIQVLPESWTAIQPREMTLDGVRITL